MSKIIDISQEVFSSNIFPGDPSPSKRSLLSIKKGDVCNLTYFSMCAHNGTHIDVPFHFIEDGKTVEQMPLDPFVGDCFVARHNGDVTAKDAENIMKKARDAGARIFADAGIKLLGNESQTVGPEGGPMQVHLTLLGADVVLLEGIVLENVDEGRCFLSAAPLDLGGCDGAPCRAYIIK